MAKTKFAQNITNNGGALARRAEVLETQARIAQETLINNLKKDKSDLEISVMNMTDFSPESTDSLRPGSANFNADEWAAQLQETKMDIRDLNIQIKIAEDTYKEFFEASEDINLD